MEKLVLQAKMRDVVGKQVKHFRKEGMVPVVMYGHKVEPKNLWVQALELDKTYVAAGENTILELVIDGAKGVNVLIQDIQADPLSGRLAHADFFQVHMDEEIEASIPLEFVGESPVVKEMGGVLVKSLDEVEVSCLPADLPQAIEVDISAIKTFDDHIKVRDLKVSPKVKIVSESDTTVALVTPPRTEAELASLNEKVDADVTKVEGVVKETSAATDKK